MEEIKSMLHLDDDSHRKSPGRKNLEDLKKNGYYDRCDEHLRKTGLKRTDIIRNFDLQPIGKNGAIAVLKGQSCSTGQRGETQRRSQRNAQRRAESPAIRL